MLFRSQRERAVVYQAYPDQTIALLHGKDLEAQTRGDGSAGMRGNAGAAAFAIVAQPVILADDLVAFDVAHAERNTTMLADVPGCGQRAVGEAVDDDALIKESDCVGLAGDLMREGDRIPEGSKRPPIGLWKGASARKNCLIGAG